MLQRAKGNRRDLAMLTLLVDTGCRKREVASLTVADLSFPDGTLRFPVSKSMVGTVPLTDRAVLNLQRWLRQRGVGGGSLWNVTAPYQLVRQVVRRHSRGTLTPHALRRTFAVCWLCKGGSETSLMRLAGSTSRGMIVLYSRASADTTRTRSRVVVAELRLLPPQVTGYSRASGGHSGGCSVSAIVACSESGVTPRAHNASSPESMRACSSSALSTARFSGSSNITGLRGSLLEQGDHLATSPLRGVLPGAVL